MASVINVFYAPSSKRSKILAAAMQQGITRCGDKVNLINSTTYEHRITADAAVFYGLSDRLNEVFRLYREKSTAVYIDLGYWQRRLKHKHDGYHKLSVNSRHPTAYFQNRQHDDSRFKKLDIDIQPWRKTGNYVMLAGMSAKASAAEGFAQEQWEKEAAKLIQSFSKYPIHYRPKPSWSDARQISGTIFQRSMELNQALAGCHAVATHHSNVAIDAILAGVPAFCEQGVASVMGCSDVTKIDTPIYPEGREQWAADIAWCQFTVEEIATGMPWHHLKSEGLVPT